MAQDNLLYTSVFLVLIFSQEIQTYEGRQLKLGRKNELHKLQTYTKIIEKESRKILEQNCDLLGEDNIDGPQDTLPSQNPRGYKGDSTPSYKGDFRPTRSGDSPGIGHCFAEYKEEINPKALGNSVGIEHSVTGYKNVSGPTRSGDSPGIGH